jgi:hypothetical protein
MDSNGPGGSKEGKRGSGAHGGVRAGRGGRNSSGCSLPLPTPTTTTTTTAAATVTTTTTTASVHTCSAHPTHIAHTLHTSQVNDQSSLGLHRGSTASLRSRHPRHPLPMLQRGRAPPRGPVVLDLDAVEAGHAAQHPGQAAQLLVQEAANVIVEGGAMPGGAPQGASHTKRNTHRTHMQAVRKPDSGRREG